MADKWLCCETFDATLGGNKFYRVTDSRGIEPSKGFQFRYFRHNRILGVGLDQFDERHGSVVTVART